MGKRGRPEINDARALGMMAALQMHFGVRSAPALALAVIKLGQVPLVGEEASRIQRLARRFRAEAKTFALSGDPDWTEGFLWISTRARAWKKTVEK